MRSGVPNDTVILGKLEWNPLRRGYACPCGHKRSRKEFNFLRAPPAQTGFVGRYVCDRQSCVVCKCNCGREESSEERRKQKSEDNNHSQAKTSTASSSWMDSQADKRMEAQPSQANIESPTTQPTTDEDGPKAKRRRKKADNAGGKGVKNRQQSEGNGPNKKKTRRDWGKDIIEISDTGFWMNEPPKHSPTAQGKFPFNGDFKGCSWNGQALFAAKAKKQFPKMRKAIGLSNAHDFTCIQEAHSTEGKTDMLTLPKNLTSCWSNISTSQAGIGIILKKSFLEQFNPVNMENDWTEVIPGRVGRLRLNGPKGAMDIFAIYMDAHSGHERKQAMDAMKEHIAEQMEVLTVLAGDWNAASEEKGRYCYEAQRYTGDTNREEAEYFKKEIQDEFGFAEWRQEHYTCDIKSGRSRIDRAYCNQHVCFQLNKSCSVAALDWAKHLSSHRPISFERRSAEGRTITSKVVDNKVIHQEGWLQRVIQEFFAEIERNGGARSGLQDLASLKKAIRTVSDRMATESKDAASEQKEDKVGWTIKCAMAVEAANVTKARMCVRNYPKLSEWAGLGEVISRSARGIQALRNHAVELVRQEAEDELRELEDASKCGMAAGAPPQAKCRKDHILRRISKLIQGKRRRSGQSVVTMVSLPNKAKWQLASPNIGRRYLGTRK